MNNEKAIFLAVLLVILLSVPSRVQAVGPEGRGEAKAYGTTYGEMSAAWWEWVGMLPNLNHPLTSTGPVDCSMGQTGPIWFLAGVADSLNGTSVTRSCMIPDNRALFYPLVNSVFLNFPGDCGRPDGCTVDEKRDILDDSFDIGNPLTDPSGIYPCDIWSTLDGEPIQYLYPFVRIQSPPFNLAMNNDVFLSYPAGTEDPEAVSDGYWVLIPPLTVGSHTIQIHGALCVSPGGIELFEVDVTYDLTVED
jgi:hypothetical protein